MTYIASTLTPAALIAADIYTVTFTAMTVAAPTVIASVGAGGAAIVTGGTTAVVTGVSSGVGAAMVTTSTTATAVVTAGTATAAYSGTIAAGAATKAVFTGVGAAAIEGTAVAVTVPAAVVVSTNLFVGALIGLGVGFGMLALGAEIDTELSGVAHTFEDQFAI